nr:retrovirus-related Pol polyprotein from transposon TNT 1-94 [Tanacetum cinerariifolium]
MIGNKCYLTKYEDYDGGFVSFGYGQAKKKKGPEQDYILIPMCKTDPLISQGPKDSVVDARKKATKVDASQVLDNGEQDTRIPIVTPINDTGIFGNAYDDEAVEEEVDMNNVTLVDLPKDKWAIGTKWVFRNKKHEKGIVIKNKARLVAQGHIQEEASEDIQCAGFDHDHTQEAACAYHEENIMHDCVQLDHVVDSHDEYMNDSNIIMYDQYVRDYEVPIVHNGASSVPTDAFMMIYDDMCEPHDQSVYYPSQNIIVKNSLTAELVIYKEQVELYEQRAKFELTEREQKINEQLRIVISDRNFKEETLKKDLHSIKLQLASTIKHNKSMVEELSFLKKDFKQKENKYLADFLNIKTLKEKVEDKLIKQDQSLQTIHMLCKPRPNSN